MLSGLNPATILSVDRAAKTCMVLIEGITPPDGWEAEIMYPIGDDGAVTDRQIVVGALVYVDFLGGDSNHPIVVGARNKKRGNETEWRRIAQTNIELNAGIDALITAGSGLKLLAQSVEVSASGALLLQAESIVLNAQNIALNAPNVTATGSVWAAGDVRAGTVSLLTHIHTNTKPQTGGFSGVPL